MNKLIRYFSSKYLAAWVILLSDVSLVFVSYVVASILRYNFEIQQIEFSRLLIHGALSTAIYAVIFFTSGTSTAVLRHSGLLDLIKVVKSSFLACLILVAVASVLLYGFEYRGIWLIPKSILIIQFLLASFLLCLSRLIAKATYAAFLRNNSDLKVNILIFGAGESGRITCQTILSGRTQKRELRNVIGFVDDNKSLQGKSLEGLPIYPANRALSGKFITNQKINQVIISTQRISPERKAEVTDICLEHGVEIKEIPPYDRWIHGELSMGQIQPVKIQNLLGRSEIELTSENIERELKSKIILITGGAGSIGRELVRQALYFHPNKIIVLDQAETPLYDLKIELLDEFEDAKNLCEFVVGDINDQDRIRYVFSRFTPEIVFHAAAYKHVPLMEVNPFEAAKTNILGTRIVADLAIENGVQKFVLVSTDKAVNPTNVMGATKRVSEMYIQALSTESSRTKFVTTRFGNVLGSSGSVIPLFQKQIEQGGPVTLTHKDITRFFMTTTEACNLVLEAGSMGEDGEIFVFDMGKPVKIYDLARKMIQLSGLKVGDDIVIEITGLRPGEKLYEEVLANKENTIPTHHDKILKALNTEVESEKIRSFIIELENQLSLDDALVLVATLKKMVPEFISNNSEFGQLDSVQSKLVNEA